MRRRTLVLMTALVFGLAGLASLAILRYTLQQRRHLQTEQARAQLLAALETLRGETGEAVAALRLLAFSETAGAAPALNLLRRQHPRTEALFALQPGGQTAAGELPPEVQRRFDAFARDCAASGDGFLKISPAPGERLFVWTGGACPSCGLGAVLDFAGFGERLRLAGMDYAVSLIQADGAERPWLRSTPEELDGPVQGAANLKGFGWWIRLAPSGGWSSVTELGGGLFFSLLLTLLCTAIAFEVGRRSLTLREEVERKSARLLDAHRRLSSEIRKREDVEAQLRHHAHHDPLTGLPNRAALAHQLRHLGQRRFGNASFLLVDIGRIKAINDALGQVAGDLAIVQIAHRMRGRLPEHALLYRVGADEFGVLLDETLPGGPPGEVAERVCRAFQEPFVLQGEPFHVSIVIGVAGGAEAPLAPEKLPDAAHAAVQSAKNEGPPSIRSFEPRMLEQARARFETEIDLRRAIQRGELHPHLQPILDLGGGRVSGFEALVRWEHPDFGLIPPGRFLPLAEDTGLMADISLQVFEQICQLARDWRQRPRQGDFYISFNLSAADLQNPDCWKTYRTLMDHHGVNPRDIAMELTETIIMDDPKQAAELLTHFRDAGIRLLLDDFGTGHSSLSYLHRFSFDVLKIDRSFVSGIDRMASHQNLTRSISRLALDLGMTTVAEGIENQQELEMVREIGCDYGQGYLFSKPLPAPQAEKLLDCPSLIEPKRLDWSVSNHGRNRRAG